MLESLLALGRGLFVLAAGVIALGITLWTFGAVYYDVGRGRRFALPAALTWVGAVVALFYFLQPLWLAMLVLLAVWAGFMAWWFSQKPSMDRDWDPNFVKLPRFDIDGQHVIVHNVRNTEYVSPTEFTPRFETREYDLSKLRGVDGVIITWGSPWICHPMLVFDFGDDGRLCISIEIRYRQGQRFSFFPTLYRRQEIMYVVSDERDAMLKRIIHDPGHELYLYRLRASHDEDLKVFLEYVVSTNKLADRPRWYHGLTSNCTTSIYRQRTRQVEWDLRWLLNGRLDEMIYEHGRLDQRLPFEELRRQSRITELAKEAPPEGFGDFIRENLPGYRELESDEALTPGRSTCNNTSDRS